MGAFETIASRLLNAWLDSILYSTKTSSDDGTTPITLPSSSTNFTPYIYNPLPTPSSIRLLHLHPGDDKSPLKVTFSIVDLADKPTYTALSYSWKRDVNWCNKDQVDAMTSARPLSSTSNSSGRKRWFPPFVQHATMTEAIANRHEETRPDALVQLRRRITPGNGVVGTYWINAVCMNQADVEERAAQVSIMGRIYSEAKDVVVWLGAVPGPLMRSIKGLKGEEFGRVTDVEDHNDVLDNDRETVDAGGEAEVREAQVEETLAEDTLAEETQTDQAVEQTPYQGHVIELNVKGKRELIRKGVRFAKKFSGVFFVLSRRWFQRVWTLQEFLLSRDVVFLCGEAEFTTEKLGDMLTWIGNPAPKFGLQTVLERLGADEARIDQSIKDVAPSPPDLSETDEYEKLRSKPLWPVLAPDYTVSTEEALLNLEACLLSRPNNITLLSYVGEASEYTPIMGGLPRAALDFMTNTRPSTGPSWHLDPSSLVSRTLVPFKHLGGRFNACTSVPNSTRISANGKELSLLAHTIDTVDKVWQWFNPPLPEDLLDMLLYLESAPTTYPPSSSSSNTSSSDEPETEPLLKAIAHTNLADIWAGTSPAPSDQNQTTTAFLHALHKQITQTTADLRNTDKSTNHDTERRRLSLPTAPHHTAFLSLSPDARAARLSAVFDSIKAHHDIAPSFPTNQQPSPLKDYTNVASPTWRTFFVTTAGLVGLGPFSLGKGDTIMLVPGTYTPYAFSTPQLMAEKERDRKRTAMGGNWAAQVATRLFGWAGRSQRDPGWGGDGQERRRRGDGVVLLGEAYVRGWMDGRSGLGFERVVVV
ncbi:heterokaryon incompatibility protein-domain-containing protein [Cladorrhinum sp. PSN259]|nr:heterokaryon incompatibility protein-domain-containing protein [Cladorrhinum sp. PSN259]